MLVPDGPSRIPVSLPHAKDRHRVPTLLVSGRYDEATPHIVEQIHSRIPGAQWELFDNSSHMPHVEEAEAFLERVEAFLTTVD